MENRDQSPTADPGLLRPAGGTIPSSRMPVITFLGRILLASIFITTGLSKIPGYESTLDYMRSVGMSLPQVFLLPAIFLEVIGGLFLLLGYRARTTSLILALYLIPVTFIFHGFWRYEAPEMQMQLTNFLKNLAIIGGLCFVAGLGAGAFSIDAIQERRRLRKLQTESDGTRIRMAG